MRLPRWLLILACGMTTVTLADSPDKFSGLMYGDYYTVLEHHHEDVEGANGFWFRNIYFTYDRKVSEAFKVRLKLEMKSPGDFQTQNKLNTRVKEAYGELALGRHHLFLGISVTPTWENLEDVWGHRWVEKTPLDLHDMGTGEDFGLALAGPLDAEEKWSYWVMAANGTGNESERDEGKKVLASLGYRPSAPIYLEGYLEHETYEEGRSAFTYQGFAGLTRERLRAGIQYAHKSFHVNGEPATNFRILSLFVIPKLSKDLDLILRVDRAFDPDPNGVGIPYLPFHPEAESTLLLAGLSFPVAQGFKLAPNVEYIRYTVDDGKEPPDDLLFRITFFYKW